MEPSRTLEFAQTTLQEVALVIMGLVYTTRLIWYFRFKAGKERQPPTGTGSTAPRGSIAYSLGIIAMPWAMESSRRNLFFYSQFVLFHIGVVAAIGLSFIIPYAPGLLESTVFVRVLQVLMGLACLIGCVRFIRRVSVPVMRALSSPDDYFSLLLLTIWFFFAALAAPNDWQAGEGALVTFFVLTAFFLLYVPFSKISHYLYYPFTRYYFGKTMGRRGTYPVRGTSAH